MAHDVNHEGYAQRAKQHHESPMQKRSAQAPNSAKPRQSVDQVRVVVAWKHPLLRSMRFLSHVLPIHAEDNELPCVIKKHNPRQSKVSGVSGDAQPLRKESNGPVSGLEAKFEAKLEAQTSLPVRSNLKRQQAIEPKHVAPKYSTELACAVRHPARGAIKTEATLKRIALGKLGSD
jgi:hypothetical protein